MGKVDVLGMRVDDFTKGEVVQLIGECIRRSEKRVFAYVNVHAVNIGRGDQTFRDFINNAAVVYCDGEGVRVGARILGAVIRERIVLTRWIWELAEWCSNRGISVFLLGGRNGAAERAMRALRHRFPQLNIVGMQHGYFDKNGSENEQVVRKINEAHPQMLFVGFGMPQQEHWIDTNLDRLSVNAVLPCGAMLDYVSGDRRPAPEWMSKSGLEWLHRLAHEPGRLWYRYLVGNPLFVTRVLFHRMIRRRSG